MTTNQINVATGPGLALDSGEFIPADEMCAPAANTASGAADLTDTVCKALRRAWQLGQTYWQQADSESFVQHKKSETTHAAFVALLDDTRAALASAPAQAGVPASLAGPMQFGGCPECGSRTCVARECSRTVSHKAQVIPGVQWQCGQQASGFAAPQPSPSPAPAQANTKTHDLLGTMIGLFLWAKDKIGYKPGSVIDKVVAEAVEHLKDWPYPEPAPAQPGQEGEALQALFREALAWGMVYGPEIPAHQWDEMRELMVKQYADRAARAAPQPAVGARALAGTLPERASGVPAERQGLFRKFDVRRVDGSDLPGGKHHGCRYFVLDVDHDQHAHAALTAYAAACESSHPELAADLRSKWGATHQPATADAVNEKMLAALKHAQKVLNHKNLPLECAPINEAILAAQREAKP